MNTYDKFSILVQTGIPVLITGNPGEAKTAYINSIAKVTGRHLETVIASIRDASEIGGIPHLKNGTMHLSAPSWALNLSDAAIEKNGKGGILFFDEITCSMPSQQAALLRVIHEKVVGEIKLPDSTWMVAAANPPDIAANGWEMSLPMANRFLHMDWSLDNDTWINGMINGFKEPNIKSLNSNWREYIPSERALIAAFIKTRPNLLRVSFQNTESLPTRAFPSPRSWDMAATACAAFTSMGVDCLEAASYAVGEGAAIEFSTWRKNMDIPDPESLLKKPSLFKVEGQRDDLVYATLFSVVGAVANKWTPERYDTAFSLCDIAKNSKKADIAVCAARSLVNTKPKNSSHFSKMASEFMPLLREAGVMSK